jgi:hypothetical protein
MEHALVLACGESPTFGAGEVVRLPAWPGAAQVDPLLAQLGDRRLVVIGTDPDLAAVVLRLLRTERLGAVTIGYVPVEDTPAARLYGLPWPPEQSLRLAVQGDVDPVPLIRDDAGGVLVGSGLLIRPRAVVYCDDKRVLRGTARYLEVAPDPGAGPDTAAGGLVVRVLGGKLFQLGRSETAGRAVQIGCTATYPYSDGVPHERPVRRWTWYRHTEDLRLVRGLI